MSRVACHLVAWPRFRIGVVEAARLGFDACESFLDPLLAFDGGEPALRKLLGDNGIAVSSAYADARLDDAERDTDRLMEGCRLLRGLGADRLVISVASPAGDVRSLAERLDALGRAAAGEGVRLCVHPHSGSAIATARDLERVMAHTDPALVALCADTGELIGAGLDPAAVIRRVGERIGHVHLKDVHHDGSGTVCELGSGLVDLTSVFAALDAIAYRGWLVVEMEDASSSTDSVRRCIDALRRHRRWEEAA